MMNNGYENRAYYAPRSVMNSDIAPNVLSEGARRANEQAMRRMLTQAFCGLDTCALLCFNSDDVAQSQHRQIRFLETLERLCEEEQINLFTSVRVYEELCKHEQLGTQPMRRCARRALDFIRRMNSKQMLTVSARRCMTETNADQELFLLCSEAYLEQPVCMFTLDRDLAKALHRQNENRMVRHHEILVRRVNMHGCMSEFDFTRPAPAAEPEKVCEPQEVRVNPMQQEQGAHSVSDMQRDFCMDIERRWESLPKSLRQAEEIPQPRVGGMRMRMHIGMRMRIDDMILTGCEFGFFNN